MNPVADLKFSQEGTNTGKQLFLFYHLLSLFTPIFSLFSLSSPSLSVPYSRPQAVVLVLDTQFLNETHTVGGLYRVFVSGELGMLV